MWGCHKLCSFIFNDQLKFKLHGLYVQTVFNSIVLGEGFGSFGNIADKCFEKIYLINSYQGYES